MQRCRGMTQVADDLRQRTFRYGLRIISLCHKLPDTWQSREIGRQLLRAGMGVPGNYWSACRGRSRAEFIAKLGVAADEAEECVLWLTAIIQSGINHELETKGLLGEGEELRAILSKSHKTARENRQRKAREAKSSRTQLAKSPSHEITNSPITKSNAALP